jgi:hypothetical protein
MEAVKLNDRDFVLLIDNSGSMARTDQRNGRSRFEAVEEATVALSAKAIKYDPDGLTLYIFNTNFKREDNIASPERVARVFAEHEPTGSTGLDFVLAAAFKDYLERKLAGKTKPNGEIMIVVTDGEPDSPASVKSEIEKFTHKLDRDEEYGILFVQVGNDAGATSYLKTLDDNLSGAKFDIVDTLTAEELAGKTITEALAGAIAD